MEWYKMSGADVYREFDTNERGLSDTEAKNRISKFGFNKLPEAPQKTTFDIFIGQFQSPVIYILLLSAIIVFAMGDITDGLIILAVLVLNAVVGAFQEGKAQNTFRALEKMVKTQATIIRNDRELVVLDEEVVPGDILILKEGDKIPADARITELTSLQVDESAFTGESNPVSKVLDPIRETVSSPAEQKNMLFKGTYIVGGLARAVVVATGASTYIGAISMKLSKVDTDVPLKANIKKLSRIIIISVVAIIVFVFFLGLYHGIPLREMFSTSVAIAVSIIPEGLPVVVTIILATGMRRMSKHNALVKKLQAVEALGQATVIAVDKTGTVTYNQMMLQKLYVSGTIYDVTGKGYEPKGEVLENDQALEVLDHPDILLAGKIASLTASATVAYMEKEAEWRRLSGDPTEAALLVFSEKLGFHRDELLREYPVVFEMPFSSATKYHATVHQTKDSHALFVAGAPEVILEHVHFIWKDNKKTKITESDREAIRSAMSVFSKDGLRVLALAARMDMTKTVSNKELPEELCFVGLTGISDGIRPEVHEAVSRAQDAGVRVVMITGDYMETAEAIARKAHIFNDGDVVITGKDLNEKPESEIRKLLPHVSVFARVSPEDKLKIIELYRKSGQVIAMTGDGVNDALSLAAADLGVSMGKGGTEVAKEASDIVLLDDNFGSIVTAIEEGRNIYQTIKKVVLYLFSTGIGEVLTIIVAIALDFPLPVIASQIIWLNFVTDGFLVVALALEPKERKLLDKKMLKKKHALLDKAMGIRMVIMGTVMMIGTMFLFTLYLPEGIVKAGTMALTVLAVYQWFNVWNSRSSTEPAFNRRMFQNKALILSFLAVIVLQCLAIYTPFFQKILHTTPITLHEWLIVIGIAASIILVDDLWKILNRIFSCERFSKKISVS